MSSTDTIAMEDGETFVCEVDVRYCPRAWAGMGFAVLASAAFAALAFDLYSPLIFFGPVFAKILGGLGFLFFGALALIRFSDARVSQYLLTSRRIIPILKNGQQWWEGGFELDFFRACEKKASAFLSKLSLPTLMMDHGHPDWVHVGPLTAAQNTSLSEAFDQLRAAWLSARAEQIDLAQNDGEGL